MVINIYKYMCIIYLRRGRRWTKWIIYLLINRLRKKTQIYIFFRFFFVSTLRSEKALHLACFFYALANCINIVIKWPRRINWIYFFPLSVSFQMRFTSITHHFNINFLSFFGLLTHFFFVFKFHKKIVHFEWIKIRK